MNASAHFTSSSTLSSKLDWFSFGSYNGRFVCFKSSSRVSAPCFFIKSKVVLKAAVLEEPSRKLEPTPRTFNVIIFPSDDRERYSLQAAMKLGLVFRFC